MGDIKIDTVKFYGLCPSCGSMTEIIVEVDGLIADMRDWNAVHCNKCKTRSALLLVLPYKVRGGRSSFGSVWSGFGTEGNKIT